MIHFCIPSDGKRNIIDALSEGILKLDGVSDLVDSVSDIFSLTDTKPDSTPQSVDEPRVSEQLQLSAHMNLDLAHLLVRANELETVLPVIKESKILSVKYHSQLSMALAKSVVPIEVGQLGWTSAVENLVAETCGWISIIAECPSELPVLSTLMYLSWTPEETTDRIMLSFSSVEIDNALRLASPVETNQDVLCLIRWSLVTKIVHCQPNHDINISMYSLRTWVRLFARHKRMGLS